MKNDFISLIKLKTTQFVSGGQNSIKLWDLETGKCLKTFNPKNGSDTSSILFMLKISKTKIAYVSDLKVRISILDLKN